MFSVKRMIPGKFLRTEVKSLIGPEQKMLAGLKWKMRQKKQAGAMSHEGTWIASWGF